MGSYTFSRKLTNLRAASSILLNIPHPVPLAAYATIDDGQMFLRALVGNHMTGEFVTAEYTGPANEPEENARKVLDQLIEKGAKRLLKEVLGK